MFDPKQYSLFALICMLQWSLIASFTPFPFWTGSTNKASRPAWLSSYLDDRYSTTTNTLCLRATADSGSDFGTSSTAAAGGGVTVQRLPDSVVQISIPVAGSATKAAYDKVCMELSKNIQVPGFRRGSKIPPQVLEQAMSAKGGRNALKVQAINELLRQVLEPTLKQHALDPIGQASLVVPAEDLANQYVPGEELVLPVRCDVWPDIKWKTIEGQDKPYVGLKGKYSRKPFNQARLDLALRDLKEKYATLEPIEDDNYQLQMGDACTVNMEGFMANPDGSKGEPLPNAASGDRVDIVLGKGRYMEGLVEGLVGAKVGETRTVSVTFPEKLRDKTLAGQRAVFDVEVLQASKRTVPEVTDEFAARVKAGLTAESMMAELIKAIDAEDAKEFVPARNKALGEALAQVVEVDVPDTLITNQAKEKFAVMMAEMRDGGVADDTIKKQINPENFQKYKDIVKDDIARDFRVSMATDEIARLEGITVPDYQVEEQMQAIRKDAGEDEEFDEKVIRAKVETTLVRNAVMEWLSERASLEIEYKEEKFDEDLLQKLADESLERERKLAAGEVTIPPTKETVVAEGSAPDQVVSEVVEASYEGETQSATVEEVVVSDMESVVQESILTMAAEPAEEQDEDLPAEAVSSGEDAAEEPTQVTAEEAVPSTEEEKAAAVDESTVEAVDEQITMEIPAAATKETEELEQPQETEEERAARYASMSLEDRAFQILLDLGAVKSNQLDDEEGEH